MDDNMFTFFEDALYAKEGENPSKAIENQEKRGQKEVVNLQLLPKKTNIHTVPKDIRYAGVDKAFIESKDRLASINKNVIAYTKQQYEKMGIVVRDGADDLFYRVELPKGWEIKAINILWYNLLDDKGRVRAKFFFKGEIYDSDAFINFNKRYNVVIDHVAGIHATEEEWRQSDLQGTVRDGETIIFQTERVPATEDLSEEDKIIQNLRQIVESYMKENYPDYKDINAYWD